MTYYICQVPHVPHQPAKIWTADSEGAIIEAIIGDGEMSFGEPSFETALEAARYDYRSAYVTDDPLDLFLWISFDQAAQEHKAYRPFFDNYSIQLEVEELAEELPDDDDVSYRAFDGRMTWSENEREYYLDNQPGREADNLFHALAYASVQIARESKMEQHDV